MPELVVTPPVPESLPQMRLPDESVVILPLLVNPVQFMVEMRCPPVEMMSPPPNVLVALLVWKRDPPVMVRP